MQIRKILTIAIVGAALILAWVFLKPHTGIVYKLEASPELTRIATASDAALSQMDIAISDFAKANNLLLSMHSGPNKHELFAELTRLGVRLIVTNPFTDPHEVHLYAYKVADSQISKTEITTLFNQLGCKVLASCK